MPDIPLVDLKAQYAAIQPDIDAAIDRGYVTVIYQGILFLALAFLIYLLRVIVGVTGGLWYLFSGRPSESPGLAVKQKEET